MFDVLRQAISSRVHMSDADFELVTSSFIPKKLRKKQFLLQEGDICKYTAFVSKGCLRTYTVDKDAKEHIIQIAIEGWWSTDLYSFLTGEPSTYFIEALEECELLLLDRENREKLMNSIPSFEKLMRLMLENNYIATHRRVNSMMSNTAEERYLNYMKTYPQILQRVPQHMIASYLGITPETLSRIRQALAKHV